VALVAVGFLAICSWIPTHSAASRGFLDSISDSLFGPDVLLLNGPEEALARAIACILIAAGAAGGVYGAMAPDALLARCWFCRRTTTA